MVVESEIVNVGIQFLPVAFERSEMPEGVEMIAIEITMVGRTRTTATGDFWLRRMDPCLLTYIHVCTLLPGKLHDMRLWCIDWKLGLQVAFWRLRHEGIWISSRFLIKIPHELAGVIITRSLSLYLSPLLSLPFTLDSSTVLVYRILRRIAQRFQHFPFF